MAPVIIRPLRSMSYSQKTSSNLSSPSRTEKYPHESIHSLHNTASIPNPPPGPINPSTNHSPLQAHTSISRLPQAPSIHPSIHILKTPPPQNPPFPTLEKVQFSTPTPPPSPQLTLYPFTSLLLSPSPTHISRHPHPLHYRDSHRSLGWKR